MSNFTIEFLNSPWWLLLLIPAFALAMIPHFRIAKKYRRNRNRIVSLVLHLVIVTLCIFTLSGIKFSYDLSDTSNEVLILVDMSYSSETFGSEQNNKNDFVRSVIDASDGDYRVGVITFGYDQVYAAKMRTDTDAVYADYLRAERPNDSASNIAAALEYARNIFTDGCNGKVVLITDGAETDGDAMTVIRMLVANGIQVHTAYFPDDFSENNEVLISDVTLPDYTVSLDEAFPVTATLRARNSGLGEVTVTLYDDTYTEDGDAQDGDEERVLETRTLDLTTTEQVVEFEVTLTNTGMHKLRFGVESGSDDVEYNNDYYSYVYIESFNKILVIEKESGDSDVFVEKLGEEIDAAVVNIADGDNMPNTLNALRNYDEVVLMNIANRDMPEGFIELLHAYVHDIGGGLFTVGGTRENEYGKEVPNMYDRDDMYNVGENGVMIPTLYQDMLPVQSINYTPPLGVMIIIDRSGSMNSPLGGETRLDAAKRGAIAAVYALSERDYCGIMTLDTEFNVEQSLIPATQQTRLLRTINDIEMGGGTMYEGAIRRAGEALLSIRNIERRHIILVSDGEPGDKEFEDYGDVIAANYENGITFSMVAIGIDTNSAHEQDMKKAAELGHGRYYGIWDDATLPDKMSQELKLPEITDISTDPFRPRVRDHTAAVSGVTETDIPMLGGYFGTKIKDGASIPLAGEFVPVLAHWRYGEGRVGSFMCDLTGQGWSEEFMGSDTGVKILNNTVRMLLPTANIRDSGIDVRFIEDNYSTRATIFTDMEDGDRIELSVYSVPTDGSAEKQLQKITPTAEQGYTNITFEIAEPGVYRVSVVKLDERGNILAEDNSYKVFSYSKEYNLFFSEPESKLFTEQMASVGRGIVIPLDDPWRVFDEQIDELDDGFDPRWLFMIVAIVLFLLDIAVRKFKWKWIHEIVRERREAKQAAQDDGRVPTERS